MSHRGRRPPASRIKRNNPKAKPVGQKVKAEAKISRKLKAVGKRLDKVGLTRKFPKLAIPAKGPGKIGSSRPEKGGPRSRPNAGVRAEQRGGTNPKAESNTIKKKNPSAPASQKKRAKPISAAKRSKQRLTDKLLKAARKATRVSKGGGSNIVVNPKIGSKLKKLK